MGLAVLGGRPPLDDLHADHHHHLLQQQPNLQEREQVSREQERPPIRACAVGVQGRIFFGEQEKRAEVGQVVQAEDVQQQAPVQDRRPRESETEDQKVAVWAGRDHLPQRQRQERQLVRGLHHDGRRGGALVTPRKSDRAGRGTCRPDACRAIPLRPENRHGVQRELDGDSGAQQLASQREGGGAGKLHPQGQREETEKGRSPERVQRHN
mmetsp:Transcript_32341/g.63195  ORF Transcript_32341/g.63195 Transcript_32341/m.63195 type:complete len:210 (-) Transcript_32341:344-973(-)